RSRRARRAPSGRHDGRDPGAEKLVSISLIVGDDPTVLADAVHTAVHDALGSADRDLALASLTEDDFRLENGFELAPLVDAAQTPPFLTDHRVVVGRHLGRFTKADLIA